MAARYLCLACWVSQIVLAGPNGHKMFEDLKNQPGVNMLLMSVATTDYWFRCRHCAGACMNLTVLCCTDAGVVIIRGGMLGDFLFSNILIPI